MSGQHNLSASLPSPKHSTLDADPEVPMTENNTDQVAAVAVAPPANNGEPPRASFMGLPVELRLHIYSFLLGGGPKAVRDRYHCCYESDEEDMQFPAHSNKCTCSCSPQTWPQILATSKQVFSEAMPVLYNNTEMRIVLPSFLDAARHIPFSFQGFLDAIPEYAYSHVRGILAVGSAYYTAIRLEQEDEDMLDFPWTTVIDRFPNVQNVRLHFDMDFAVETCTITLWEFDYEQLTRIADFPHVKNIILEFLDCDSPEESGAEAVSLMLSSELQARIQTKAESLGKNISVVVDCLRVEETDDEESDEASEDESGREDEDMGGDDAGWESEPESEQES